MLGNYLGYFLFLAEWLPKTRYSSNDQLNPKTLAQVEDLIKRFDVDLSGRIEFGNGEFLGVIASIAVTSVQDIDDFVFSAAFRTFDHVSVPHEGQSLYRVSGRFFGIMMDHRWELFRDRIMAENLHTNNQEGVRGQPQIHEALLEVLDVEGERGQKIGTSSSPQTSSLAPTGALYFIIQYTSLS